jgi:hypothetical protein
MRRLSSVLVAIALLVVTAVPALAAQPPLPEPLTVDCDGMVITVEFRHRGAGGGGTVAFHEGRPLLALGGTNEIVVTDADDNVVFQDTQTFRLAKGIAEDRFLHCSLEETFTFTDPELAEGELTATVTSNLLVFPPGG